MKISEAKRKLNLDYFDFVEIRKTPGKLNEYFVSLYSHDGKSFFLSREDDSVLSSNKIDEIISVLQEIGFKKAKIYF